MKIAIPWSVMTKLKLLRIPLLALVVLSSLSLTASAQEKTAPDAYSGVAVGTGGGVGSQSIGFDFLITSYTTDQDLQNFAQLLKDKGQSALTSALGKEKRGRIHVVGGTGNDIAIARKRQQGDKTIITIVTARRMSFREIYNSGRSVDYPYTFLQVTLDAAGKGDGKIVVAAKLRFNKKSGKYEVESLGNQYIRVTNIRPTK
jgi:hypothetical protein